MSLCQEVQEIQKSLAIALGHDEDETSTSELEIDDDENDTLSDLPSSLLALKSIKDEMLVLIKEPCTFMEGLLLRGLSADSHAGLVSCFLSTTLAYIDDVQYLLEIEGLTELMVAHLMGELMYQKGIHL
ncbi:hypothetical protein F4604DRAFT_1677273 [Suillus subluteus]|nr:hypothetical protein F4604DRAFT_1677273 [Suillus subluteus]